MISSLTTGIERGYRIRPNAWAVIDAGAGTRITWATFRERVARLAAALRALGVTEGERVALLADTSQRYLEVYFGVMWAGGVLAPVNTRWAPPEVRDMMVDCTPRVLFVDRTFAELGSLLDVPHVISLDDPAYDAMLDAHAPLPDAARGGDALAALFYTGGTTGRSKGVMLSHANLVSNALHVTQPLGLSDETIHLHCGPLFHVAAGSRAMATTVVSGTHLVLPRFEARKVLETIQADRPTIGVFVPSMVRAMLQVPDFERYDLSSLRLICYGAAPMPTALIEELMVKAPGCGLSQGYGQTETAPFVTTLGARYHVPGAKELRSVGRVLPNIEIRIVNPEDQELPDGTVGEVCVRGPNVMLGYWRRPEETAQALRGGWMHTGDAGYLEDGFLYLVDRIKDMIVSGGENVYSAEVENVLYDHPAVAECAVFGIPHDLWGEAVHAIVVPRAGEDVPAATILEKCRGVIAGYKIPKTVEIRTVPLPRSAAGKILKTELRAKYWK